MRIACLLFSLMLPATALDAQTGGVILLSPASTAAPFNALTLSTSNSFAPSTTLFPGFPTVPGGAPAQGYQGGVWVVNAAYPQGIALFEPWQQNVSVPIGTLLGYKGGSSGTFHCTTAGSCAANWDWFNLANVPVSVPAGKTAPAGAVAAGYTCGFIPDDQGNYYFIPGMAALTHGVVMMRYHGGAISAAGSYDGFILPTNGTAVSNVGQGYGWCGGFYADPYAYFAPTSGGGNSITTFLRYDTRLPFVLSSFSAFDLSAIGGGTGPGTGTACCYESAAYDGQQNGYLIPDTSDLVVYNTTQSFTSNGSYKKLSMAHLGTSGYPQVTGTGNLHAVQTIGAYIGGQMAWNPAGTVEYLYFAPFGPNPGGTHASTILLSTVLRVPVATCSPGVPGTQSCSGTFTALDITASTSTWEMFDLANLTTNAAWRTAGYTLPALFTTGSLTGQLTIGGFQLTWLNVHSIADPVVGFVADYGKFFVRHHVSHSLSDPTGWDVVERPATQFNGFMGGPYDPVHQILYPSGPIVSPNPSVFQLCCL